MFFSSVITPVNRFLRRTRTNRVSVEVCIISFSATLTTNWGSQFNINAEIGIYHQLFLGDLEEDEKPMSLCFDRKSWVGLSCPKIYRHKYSYFIYLSIFIWLLTRTVTYLGREKLMDLKTLNVYSWFLRSTRPNISGRSDLMVTSSSCKLYRLIAEGNWAFSGSRELTTDFWIYAFYSNAIPVISNSAEIWGML